MCQLTKGTTSALWRRHNWVKITQLWCTRMSILPQWAWWMFKDHLCFTFDDSMHWCRHCFDLWQLVFAFMVKVHCKYHWRQRWLFNPLGCTNVPVHQIWCFCICFSIFILIIQHRNTVQTFPESVDSPFPFHLITRSYVTHIWSYEAMKRGWDTRHLPLTVWNWWIHVSVYILCETDQWTLKTSHRKPFILHSVHIRD